jgi:hypothetical protein
MWNWLKNIFGNNERPDAPASEIPNPTAQNTTEIPLLPVQELTDKEKEALIKRLKKRQKNQTPTKAGSFTFQRRKSSLTKCHQNQKIG